MCSHIVIAVAAVAIGLFEPSLIAAQGSTPIRRAGNVIYLPVPESLPGSGDSAYEHVRGTLPPASGDAEDLIVVFTSPDGRVLHGDWDRAQAATPGTAPTSLTDLSFTFNSPTEPWTPAEQSVVSAALADFYPVVKTIYGPPAFTLSVNIRKDSTIGYPGLYFTSTHEIVLRSPSALDVLCHEMIHAFRDDDIILMNTFEEGMARAVEVETFNKLPAYSYWDAAHSYTYDMYYDALNRPEIATTGGNFDDGFVGGVLVRYQLAGYAWGKALIENPRFFLDFNAVYYPLVVGNPGLASSESALVGIAASVQPTVEGSAFQAWYALQHIFDSAPSLGPAIFQRLNQFTVDFFNRSSSGISVLGNTPMGWAAFDFQGTLLDSGLATTVPNGFIDFSPRVPSGYAGRLWVLAVGQAPTGQVAFNVGVRTAGPETGVFGAVQEDVQGTVGIISLENTAVFQVVSVENGAFVAPALGSVRGRFLAVFVRPNGQFVSRVFTKDASSYFLVL